MTEHDIAEQSFKNGYTRGYSDARHDRTQEVEQIKRERDAAIADLKMLSDCRTCKNNNTKHFDCMGYEWRELEDRK